MNACSNDLLSFRIDFQPELPSIKTRANTADLQAPPESSRNKTSILSRSGNRCGIFSTAVLFLRSRDIGLENNLIRIHRASCGRRAGCSKELTRPPHDPGLRELDLAIVASPLATSNIHRHKNKKAAKPLPPLSRGTKAFAALFVESDYLDLHLLVEEQ